MQMTKQSGRGLLLSTQAALPVLCELTDLLSYFQGWQIACENELQSGPLILTPLAEQ